VAVVPVALPSEVPRAPDFTFYESIAESCRKERSALYECGAPHSKGLEPAASTEAMASPTGARYCYVLQLVVRKMGQPSQTTVLCPKKAAGLFCRFNDIKQLLAFAMNPDDCDDCDNHVTVPGMNASLYRVDLSDN
jgi:hypothetical protein